MKYLVVFFVLLCSATLAFSQSQDTVTRDVAPLSDTLNTHTPQRNTNVRKTPRLPRIVKQDTLPAAAYWNYFHKILPHKEQPQRIPKWKITNKGRLNFAQTGFFYWSAGGDDAVATTAFFTASANYKNKNIAWDNTLDTEFGLVWTKKDNWKKSADKIQIASKFGYTYNSRLYYSFLGEFKTQFAKSHFKETYTSTVMAPGYLNLGLGADYKKTEGLSIFGLVLKDFTAFISPFSARFTFVLDEHLSQAGAFGVDPGERVKSQTGMSAKVAFNTTPLQNVTLATTLNLFTPYVEQFLNFVVDWDTAISMKINKYLSTTLNMSLKYDEKVILEQDGIPVGRHVQFMEIFGLGVVYSF